MDFLIGILVGMTLTVVVIFTVVFIILSRDLLDKHDVYIDFVKGSSSSDYA